MNLIAAYAHSTRAAGLKRLQTTRSALSAVLQRLPWLAGGVARKKQYDLPQARRNFLGFHCCPTGVKVSEAALSRRDVKVARLYEQGASKKRIAQYLGRWLGWAVLAAGECAAEEIFIGRCTKLRFEPLPNTWTPIYGSGLSRLDNLPGGDFSPFYQPVELNPPANCMLILRWQTRNITTTTNEITQGTAKCTPSAVEHNQPTTCTATPNAGYRIKDWTNCTSATSTCTIANVVADTTVTANFEAIPGYIPTGPVVQILIDPTTPTTVYSALDGGGVYTKVGAGNWTAATTQPTNLNVKALAIKSDSSMLFAGTDGAGVFKSTNAGATWVACTNTNLTTLNLRSLALTGTTLYAGTTAGVFVSTDDCATWTALNAGLP